MFIVHYKTNSLCGFKLEVIWNHMDFQPFDCAFESERCFRSGFAFHQCSVLRRSSQVPDSRRCPKMDIPKDLLAACFLAPSWHHLSRIHQASLGITRHHLHFVYRKVPNISHHIGMSKFDLAEVGCC